MLLDTVIRARSDTCIYIQTLTLSRVRPVLPLPKTYRTKDSFHKHFCTDEDEEAETFVANNGTNARTSRLWCVTLLEGNYLNDLLP